MVLLLGQKVNYIMIYTLQNTVIRCQLCGMVYDSINQEDVSFHKSNCKRVTEKRD